jgi:hypothetical protein
VWTAVIAGNGVIMTIFLWHLTAALLTIATLYRLGFPQPTGGSALWWATRPLFIGAALIPLVALVRTFGRVERPQPARYVATCAHGRATAGVGIALLSFAVFGIACSNVADLVANARVDVAFVTVTSLQLLAITGAGLACVRHAAVRVRVVDTTTLTRLGGGHDERS